MGVVVDVRFDDGSEATLDAAAPCAKERHVCDEFGAQPADIVPGWLDGWERGDWYVSRLGDCATGLAVWLLPLGCGQAARRATVLSLARMEEG